MLFRSSIGSTNGGVGNYTISEYYDDIITTNIVATPSSPSANVAYADMNAAEYSNDKLPAGFNTIVAIMTNTGYNQEDGVIINKTSIDRGMYQLTAYKSYSAQESSVNKNQYNSDFHNNLIKNATDNARGGNIFGSFLSGLTEPFRVVSSVVPGPWSVVAKAADALNVPRVMDVIKS